MVKMISVAARGMVQQGELGGDSEHYTNTGSTMFSKASRDIRESTYGFMGFSLLAEDGPKKTVNVSNGTAFMVAPGFLITAAHTVHQESNRTKPVHQSFEFIRAPEIGQQMEKAIFVAEHPVQDIALLKIEMPKDSHVVTLKDEIVPRGTSCGFLGFPLASVQFMPNGKRHFNLYERFQGASISNYMENTDQAGDKFFYEIDNMMYEGSSGCPAFTTEAEVVGMQVASRMLKQKESQQLERVAISLIVPSVAILRFLESEGVEIAP